MYIRDDKIRKISLCLCYEFLNNAIICGKLVGMTWGMGQGFASCT